MTEEQPKQITLKTEAVLRTMDYDLIYERRHIVLIDHEQVQQLQRMYPPDTRIVLERMGDDPRSIPPGTTGTVHIVDDMGTVHCNFDNGRRLGLIPGVDKFCILPPRTKEAERG
jgi:hypothetical protein